MVKSKLPKIGVEISDGCRHEDETTPFPCFGPHYRPFREYITLYSQTVYNGGPPLPRVGSATAQREREGEGGLVLYLAGGVSTKENDVVSSSCRHPYREMTQNGVQSELKW